MTTNLPMLEVPDAFFVEEYLQIAVEAAAEIGFQFRVQPGQQRGHRFTRGIVALMGVGDEKVVGHGDRKPSRKKKTQAIPLRLIRSTMRCTAAHTPGLNEAATRSRER